MNGSSVPYSHLRIFDANGAEQTSQYVVNGSTVVQWTAPAAGSYYIGVGDYYNTAYDPTKAGSGNPASFLGAYQLNVERRGAAESLLTSIAATSTHGTPAQGSVASANVGQTITIAGSNLQANEQLVFTALDPSGVLYEQAVTAASVAVDGSSLTVVVPTDATTGTVRLARDQVGLLLQIVPTLDGVSANPGQSFAGGSLSLKLPEVYQNDGCM